MIRIAKSGLLITFLAFICLVPALGQQGSRLRGTIKDSTGGIVPGVLVVATNEATSIASETFTNEAGIYIFPVLSVGTYTVSAEIDGFKKSIVSGFRLETATSKTLDFTLEVGALTQEISVSAGAVQQIQLDTSDLGDIVFEKKIKDLPLNGRLPIQLVLLQAGMAGHPQQGNAGGFTANGGRRAFNTIYLDGIDVTSSELGTGSNVGGQPNVQIFTDVQPSVDAVEEFRVITGSPSAEFGRNTGFQVVATTKSGDNQFRGSLYEFHRNTVLNANNFFNNSAATPIERQNLLRNQFGGTIGGPVWIPGLYNGRDRTFFFFNYEGQRQRENQTVLRSVLTQEARQGIYRFITPGVTIDPDSGQPLNQNSRSVVDPVTGQVRPGVEGVDSIDLIQADINNFDGIGADQTGLVNSILALTPLPNDFSAATGTGDGLNTAGFRFLAPANTDSDLFTVKVDHQLNDRHSLSTRINWGGVDRTLGDVVNNAFQPFPGTEGRDRLENQLSGQLSVISTFSPTMTNEFRIGMSRNTREFSSTLTVPNVLHFSIPGSEPYRADQPFESARQTFQINNNVTWIRGQHAFKFGFLVQTQILNRFGASNAIFGDFSSTTGGNGGANVDLDQLFGNPDGGNPIPNNNEVAAADMFNFLTGRLGGFSATFNAINSGQFGPLGSARVRGFRGRDWGLFFQDDWKITQNLTLNLGLRYDNFQVPWEVNSFFVLPTNRTLISTQLDPSIPNTPVDFAPVGPDLDTRIYDSDLNNFSPVIGFSWDPFGDNKTAVRGSYRIAYDKLFTTSLNTIDGRAPGLSTEGLTNGSVLLGVNGLTNVFGDPRTPRLADLTPTPTNLGSSIGSGNVDLGGIIDVTQNQVPLETLPDLRQSLNPSEFETNLYNPYSQSWSFGIQHELFKNTVIEARYVGRKGSGLYTGLVANQFRVPSGWIPAIQQVDGLLKTTRGDAYAMAGLDLPDGVDPNSLVSIADLYGSAPRGATDFSQFTPGALQSLAPQELFNLFLATTSSFDSVFSNELRQIDLVGMIAAFDTSSGSRVHSLAFLESAGLNIDGVAGSGVGRGELANVIGQPGNAFRPSPQFLNGPRLFSNAGYSTYHALQLQFQRRFSDGFQLQTNYTWSKNLDIPSTIFSTGNSVNNFFERNAEKSLSGNDLTHDFKANFIYELPFGPGKRFGSQSRGVWGQLIGGWQVNGIFNWANDFPFAVDFNSQRSSFQDGERPDFAVADGLDRASGLGQVTRDAQGRVIFFAPDAFEGLFQRPLIGNLGNSPRNYLRGPGFWLLDFSVIKSFSIDERRSVQFRAEFFNVFNNVNFSNPNNNLESGTFGVITGQNGDPRIIQFGLKVQF